MIDAIDLALSGDRGQLAHGSASAAAYIQDDVLFPIEACDKPQSVTLEWREFIFRSTNRPGHPVGFWH
jgi:hypothetical protein